MKEILKTTRNYVLSVILPTIGQKVERWCGQKIYPNLIHTKIDYSQKVVDSAMNLLIHQRKLNNSVQMFAQESGDTPTEVNLVSIK